jgi:hypothetical protein
MGLALVLWCAPLRKRQPECCYDAGREPAHVLDERGQPHATRPCPQCGREIPLVTPEMLKWYGWQPWQLWSTVEWCGHRIEGIPVPDADGRRRLIVFEGEAS